MPRPSALALSCAALALALAAPARAAHPREKESPEVQKLLKQAAQDLAAGAPEKALEGLRAAYARDPNPRILLDVAAALRRLARNVEAAATYEAFLADPRADPAQLADAKRLLTDVDAVVGHLHIEASTPPTAVRIDGKTLDDWRGRALRLEPGAHTLAGDAPGFPPAVLTVTLAPSEERTVTLHFALPSVPVSGVQRTLAWSVGGVGAAILVGGVVTGILAKLDDNAAIAHCYGRTACDADGVALGHAARTSGVVSTVLFVTGAAAFGAGVVLFVTAPKPTPAPSAALLLGLDGGPWIGARGLF